jgi:hypothetical protein
MEGTFPTGDAIDRVAWDMLTDAGSATAAGNTAGRPITRTAT